jgi:hypothetical protein
MVATPLRYRTVVVRDDAGRVREERRYDVDGSLLEKKVFDQNGILRDKPKLVICSICLYHI